MPNDLQSFVEPFRRLMQQVKSTPATHHIRNRPFVFRDLHTCTHIFLIDDSAKRPLEQSYTGPHRIVERISECVFAMEVDGKRLNTSVECLKLVYFTAQQREQAVNKSFTVQSSMKPPSSRKGHSILKTYPSASQLKNKQIMNFQKNKLAKIILNIYNVKYSPVVTSLYFYFELYFLFIYNVFKSNYFIFLTIWRGRLSPPIRKHRTRTSDDALIVARPLVHKNARYRILLSSADRILKQ